MIIYPRFRLYELHNIQKGLCHCCSEYMNFHDMELENIMEDHLFCYECVEEKKDIISDYDKKQSITEMNLRPFEKYMQDSTPQNEEQFIFSKESMIVTPDYFYVNEAYEEEEIESEIDPEEKIKSSWYHRAMLGDENREVYDDGQDTDFEAVEEFWRMKHEQEELEDLDMDINSQLVFDFKS